MHNRKPLRNNSPLLPPDCLPIWVWAAISGELSTGSTNAPPAPSKNPGRRGTAPDLQQIPLRPLPGLLTVSDTALFLNVSQKTVHRLIRSGVLESVRVGRSVRVYRDALEHFLESPERGGS